MSFKVITSVSDMQQYSKECLRRGNIIGLVPTMGFLHEGHLSLIDKSKEKADIIIVSIFVNPTQFAPTEDFSKYPRDLDRDIELLKSKEVDVLFLPDANEIYPDNFNTFVKVKEVTERYEGEFRPTHFEGVTTIVSILFNCVKPNIAVFGRKDAQQAFVIEKMVQDLKMDIKIIVSPIIRENDGLAMSSRNIYLNANERNDALVLKNSLDLAKKLIELNEYNASVLIFEMERLFLAVPSASLDYIAIVNKENFNTVDKLKKDNTYYILVACKIGSTRLIDNLEISL